MSTIKLSNDFHGTETTVRVPPAVETPWDAWIYIQTDASKSTLRRVKRALCPSGGLPACACGVVRMRVS